MGDYNSLVYCIRCNTTDECYIGSTFYSIEERIKTHENGLTYFLRNKCNYTSSFQIIIRNNFVIEILEKFNTNKKNLLKFEQDYINLYKYNGEKVVNIINSFISVEDKIEKKKEYNKEYNQNNSEKIKEYRIENSEKIKQYYKNNSEKIKEKQKQYNKNNSEQIKEYQKQYDKERLQKITCKYCYSISSLMNIKKHQKTKKCIDAKYFI